MNPRSLPHTSPLEVVILAGGASARMGRDKSRLRLGRWTLVGILRRAGRAAGFRTRVVRRDRVPGCGPLGGVWTALQSSRTAGTLFLGCDMPFVTPRLIRLVARAAGGGGGGCLFSRGA
ncbi:MAG TPA: hypothetical protein DCM86_00850, partial [Verrucomicrobiales bacterium]|nr:hypothetical protein [Verrucomicrobiales bacterium]